MLMVSIETSHETLKKSPPEEGNKLGCHTDVIQVTLNLTNDMQ